MANNSGVCRLQDDASEHQRYVAQILDPLYYNFTDNLSSARTLGTYACMPTRITPWRRQRTSSQEIQTSQSILCRRTTARGHLRCRWTFPSRTGARYATSGWCGSRSSYSSRSKCRIDSRANPRGCIKSGRSRRGGIRPSGGRSRNLRSPSAGIA